MLLRQVLDVVDLLDHPCLPESEFRQVFSAPGVRLQLDSVETEAGRTLFFKLLIPGRQGRSSGGHAPSLGIIGYLGGIGARPHRIGLVSDADGCIAALAAGLKLLEMHRREDLLDGDVIVTTHITNTARVKEHYPVTFMESPVSPEIRNRMLVDEHMEAIISIDTTKGNRIINSRGFAISPTVLRGYILRVSEDLLQVQQDVTGRLPAVFAITTQDITPYGNGLFHLNSILQPATATAAPVVGVGITSETAVSGAATGASQAIDIEQAARFAVEIAKGYGRGSLRFYDPEEFARLVALYGSMEHLQRLP